MFPQRNQAVDNYISLKTKFTLDFKIKDIHGKT